MTCPPIFTNSLPHIAHVGCGTRVRIAVTLLAAAALAAGCTRGYPNEDAPSVRKMSVAEHLRVLNNYMAHGTMQRKLASSDVCHLVLKKTPRGDTGVMQRVVIPLLETSVDVATRPSGEGLRVKLTQHHGGQPQVRLRLDLEHWLDAVAWRSHFQQLQLHCRDALKASATQ